MWDPRTYEDTDYGLDDGETFEPEFDIDDDPFDSSFPHVMTVLGPIEPEELGVCIPATRLLPIPAPSTSERGRDIAHARAMAEAAEELEAFASVGGRSVVESATAQTGRDIAALQRLTQLVPSHLVAAAGWPADGTDPIAHLRQECGGGLDGSEVAPGLVVLDRDTLGDELLDAGFAVAAEHGLPVRVQIRDWNDASGVLTRWKGSPDDSSPALTLGGPADVPNTAIIAMASERGAFVVISVPTDTTTEAERALAVRLAAEIRTGHAASLLVTIDLVSRRVPVAAPVDPRSPYLIDRLAVAMMEANVAALDVRQVMIENPARALTIVPPNP